MTSRTSQTGFNRTFLVLKVRLAASCHDRCWRFNRTFLVLKGEELSSTVPFVPRFNRTFLVLKGAIGMFCSPSSPVLIAPFWY